LKIQCGARQEAIFAPTGGLDFAAGPFQPIATAGEQPNPRAAFGKLAHSGAPDTSRCAGDDDDFRLGWNDHKRG